MRVYRVENVHTGEGPYTMVDAPPEIWKLQSKHNEQKQRDLRPGPRDFEGQWENLGCFGFTSVRDAQWWFKGFRALLRRNGFILREYEVPSYYVLVSRSKKQCVFRRSMSELVIERRIP